MIIYGLIATTALLCFGLCGLVLWGVGHSVDPPEHKRAKLTDWWRAQLTHPDHYFGRHH